MKKVFLAGYVMVLQRLKCIRWRHRIKGTFASIIFDEDTLMNREVLILSPHADDELIGCHNLIKRQGVYVACCSLTGTNTDLDNKRKRDEEFENYCRSLNINYSIRLKEDVDEYIHKLINKRNPDIVLMPSYVDWHCEHRKINRIVRDYIEQNELKIDIGWYQVSVPISTQMVNYVQVMSHEDFKNKWKSFCEYYKSQSNINYYRMKFVERMYSNSCKYAYEVYVLLDYDTFKKYIDILDKQLSELDDLKTYLNELDLLVSKSERIYSTLKGALCTK